MKSYKQLQDAFKKLDKSTVEWHKSARFPKTMETANAILYRNAVVDASTLAYMSCCLDMPNTTTREILDAYAKENPKKQSEVAVLKRLIAPVDITATEQEFIERLRKLSAEKQHLVYDMVRSLK